MQQSLLHNYHIKLEMNQLVSEVQYADPELFSDAKPEAVVRRKLEILIKPNWSSTRQPVDRQHALSVIFGIEIKTKKPLLILLA